MTVARDRVVTDPWPAPRARGPVLATVSLPGSKSLTNRALVLAALADGPSVVRRALRSRDTALMAGALASIGTAVDSRQDDWLVVPGPLAGDVDLDCGLAGTVLRFLAPVAGLVSGAVTFDGDPHLRARPIGEMLVALRALGSGDRRRRRPVHGARDGAVRGGRVVIDASASSQFVSGLLLAGARFDQGLDLRHDGKPVPSLPHVEMTVAMLRERGVEVDDTDADRWVVAPGPVRAVDTVIEPDLSNAAPFLALAAVSGGSVTVRDWPEHTTQAGDLLREILTAMGCRVERDARRPHRPRHRAACAASTSTSTTPASSRPRWPRCAPSPTPPPTCAASPTSVATRPTGSRPWRPSSVGSAPT